MIPLYNLNEIGIIIPMKIGNTYTNQVGGSICLHTTATGIYIPFGKWSENQNDPFLGLSEFPYDENKTYKFSPVTFDFEELMDFLNKSKL